MSSQPPAALLLTNLIPISLFAREAVQKVQSAFYWSIAVQFEIICTFGKKPCNKYPKYVYD